MITQEDIELRRLRGDAPAPTWAQVIFDDPETCVRLGGGDELQRWLEAAVVSPLVSLGAVLVPAHDVLAIRAEDFDVGVLRVIVHPEQSALEVALAVDPQRRGEGIAPAALRTLPFLPEYRDALYLVGEAESDHRASQRAMHHARMVSVGRSPHGGMIFQRAL